MKLSIADADELVTRITSGSATPQDVATAAAILRDRDFGTVMDGAPVTLDDAHILARLTTEVTRWWDRCAQEAHRQTVAAMREPSGAIYDFDADGAPIVFNDWRELVRVENDPMWGAP